MADLMIKEKTKEDFDKAYFEGIFRNIVSKIKGESNSLLSFSEIVKIVKIKNETYKGMRYVPIEDIVGSEGRYNDFTREFLPERKNLRNRWEKIDEAHYKDIILPPIKVYQLGGVYFVRDGNHRVSVSKRQGKEFIDAEVVEIQTDIKLDASTTKGDLQKIIIQHEKEMFLDSTKLDTFRDVSKLEFSYPGRFDDIMTHISGHQYFLGIEKKGPVSFEEALLSWFDNLFLPIVSEIEEERIINRFIGRTSGDLYIWIIRHWDEIKSKYGKDVPISEAVRSYSAKFGESPIRFLIRLIKKIFSRG